MIYTLFSIVDATGALGVTLYFLPAGGCFPRVLRRGVGSVFLMLLLPSLFVSCFRDFECVNLRNDIVQINFKREDTEGVDALVLDTVLIEGLQPQSMYVFKKGAAPISNIAFPLNPTKNIQQIEFVISEPSGLIHRSLEIAYHVKTQFESTDCEPKFLFSNVTIAKHNFIAAAVVPSKKQSTAGRTSIEIVYR